MEATYFDGMSARAQPVALDVQGDRLRLRGDGVEREIALTDVAWPERTRHGIRVVHFKDGGSVQCSDAAAWDAWSAGIGRRDTLVVRMQQSWRWVLASVLALAALGVVLQQWGLPLLARAVAAAAPPSLDTALGEASLAAIDEHLMLPSKLPLVQQTRLREALSRLVAAQSAGTVPAWRLVFRQSRVGPNALALPGGTLILTDELVALVGADEQVLVAVLAHELGHVRHRHGLRMLVQVAALAGLSSLVLGDFSTLLAGAPVLLGQAGYSRSAEHEADVEAVRMMKAGGISPLVMLTLFDKLGEKAREAAGASDKAASPSEKPASSSDTTTGAGDKPAAQSPWLGIAFASHPSDADRVRFFREAASRP